MPRNRTVAGASHDPLNAPMIMTKDPLLSGQTTDTEQADNGQSKSSIVLPATGAIDLDELRDMLNAPMNGDVHSEEFENHAEELAFMEQEMLVRVEESTDPSAEKFVEIFCNGVPQRFLRGHWIKTKRKFVEVLARAKPFNVSTPEATDANGDRTTRIVTTGAVRYPFQVNGDPSPRGRAWLFGILQEA